MMIILLLMKHTSWHENFHFTEAMKAWMDAQCQEIEETSKKIENHMKLIFNILNIRPQQLAQGDSEIPNQEKDEQVFGAVEQTAQNLSPTVQENSLCDTKITFPSTTDDAQQKGKEQCQVVTSRSDKQVFGTSELSSKQHIICHEDSVPVGEPKEV
ncbi:hypothetical protein V6N12_035720 [Hibiscus sabdariffa]|uniref:Uncharacterized protein n=1 Tax=Hibiscus sabdariffa TaxID=183260 RepID=A0ABR2ENK6_9ROSI